MRRPAGFTLVELLISCVILGLLLTVTFMIYRMGASAWLKSDAKSELLQIAQVVTAKLNREVESSSYRSASVSADNSAVAFLSARNADGVFVYDDVSVIPHWQNYVVFYFQASSKSLLRREVGVAGTPAELAAQPIDVLGGGPVDNYRSAGRVMGSGMDNCRFSFTPDEQLVLEMEAFKTRYGSMSPERPSVFD